MIPLPIDVPPGYWQHDASHAPDPVYPMFRLLYAPIKAAVGRWFDEFGYLMEGIEFREIGGWVYLRMVPSGGREGVALPNWALQPLMWLLVRTVPLMRRRLKQAEEAVRSDKPGHFVRRWYEVWQPELAGLLNRWRDVDLTLLTNEELDKHIEAIAGLVYRGIEIHTLVVGAISPILYELVSTGKELLGWNESKLLDLVNGTSFKSTEPTRQLHELAQMARDRPSLREALALADDHTVERLADLDRTFAEAFASYQREYGIRVVRGYGLANPTLAESPLLLLNIIHSQIVHGYDPAADQEKLAAKRDKTAAEARAALEKRPRDRARFERVLSRAEQAYPAREDNEFYTLSAPLALMRYALLQLGDRLAEQGTIEQTDDVFLLELDEARSALSVGGSYQKQVRQRRAQRAWAAANPGPPSYGEAPAPPPALSFLPPAARLMMASLLWHLDLQMELEQSQQVQTSARLLQGIAASPGKFTGPVRLIRSEHEFDKLRPGDVLVCPVTSPVWSVLFPGLGALVTDKGGILSHPAIIAREYRVPAVVAVGNATSLLQDGQIVTVDGAAGTIEVATG